MKKFLLLGSILLLSLCMMAQTPVAYYPFSGNANDAIGTLNGTVNGATRTTDRFGNANSAYSFDVTGNSINLSNSNAIRPVSAITVSAWVFLQHPNAGVLGNSVISCSDDAGYNITFFEPNQIEFSVRRNNGDASVITDASSFYNAWHFIAGTYDGQFAKIYIDGVLKATNDAGAVFPIQYSATANTYIGVEPGPSFSIDPNFNYSGTIDEVKIYDVALTALQIQQEYASSGQIQKPGSGNAINFDGFDDGVEVPNSTALQFPGDLSVECWVKIPPAQNNTANADNAIIEKWGGSNSSIGYPFVIRYVKTNQTAQMARYNGSTSIGVDGVTIVGDNRWHHLAATKTGTLLSWYVDGILQGTTTDFADLSNINNTQNLNIGTRGPIAAGPNNLTGQIDEVRIWNVGMTQTQIRDRMCKKITSSDALYSNLVAYYNFDESAGTTAFDGTVNANNGTLTNTPTRVTSGAAIGNASSHDYVNAIKTVSLTHPTGENFTVTSTSGSPAGIQVYMVNEKPSILTGASGVGDNNKYFGLFQVGGTTPQYTAVYNYNGNPFVNPAIESQLRLNKRTDNTGTWSTLTDIPNEPANTITVPGESTEYILGRLGGALPLNLISFTGSKQNTDALLQWKTTNEINVKCFEVQRSENGIDFITIATLAAGSADYLFTDINIFSTKTVLYYKLKSTNVDTRAVYSNIIRLSNKISTALTVYPNPVKNIFTVAGLKQSGMVLLFNAEGKLLQRQNTTAQTITIDMSMYASGIYLLQYQSKGETVNQKIIKQ